MGRDKRSQRVRDADPAGASDRNPSTDFASTLLALLAAALFARELLPAGSTARVGPPAARGRGRDARRPTAIPRRGWRDILIRTIREAQADDIASVARSIAFSSVLAVFPALAAFVAIYGLFADGAAARDHLAALAGVLPAEALAFLGEQMLRLANAHDAGLSLTLLVSIALSLWSANSGAKALFKGLNVAYEETETRGFVALNITTLGFTLGGLAFGALGAGLLVVVPGILDLAGLHDGAAIVSLLRWPILFVFTVVLTAALYRYGPSREHARWRWVTPGSLLSTVLWLGGSGLFTWYLGSFAHYDATYGAFGAVFGFMVWLWLSSLIILFGAEFNSEIEHQTAVDSTTGPAQPLGARGASVADTVAPSPQGLLAVLLKRGD